MTDKSPTVAIPAGDSDVKPSASSSSAVDRLMSIPHIVTSIIQYASRDRPTLARLMRLDKTFYKEVAPLLYHTVAIWEETIDSFFRGSFKPCGCDECLERLKDDWGIDRRADGGLTEYGKLFSKPHGYGRYTNPAPRPKTPHEDEKASSPVRKSPKDEPLLKINITENAKNVQKGPRASESQDVEGNLEAVDDDDNPAVTLPISKKDLLRLVRVFTLGSHHESGCGIYSKHVQEFMQGVEILRILETPCAPHRTFHICENCPGGSCPIVDALNPRKIVVRNVSGLEVPFPAMWKANSKTKEMVFVLPTKMMSYTGKDVSFGLFAPADSTELSLRGAGQVAHRPVHRGGRDPRCVLA